ncbi:MAG: hypothetical protein K8F92_13885 [Hyphomicrobium sp.]|uniref:hypothetical protein n=1 Tax=Hyphomicrobium sp. TaxID=82 RepID=UPI00132921D9|nr:hypothetical protein [Hyphomicrobium sp.]KAB2943485.1 MAG: hypothetical protein F9K20_02005 [Hyphomicrobium sp.]MBZ0210732.1 hypothetical protein [Hyphomicrobium sp.]
MRSDSDDKRLGQQVGGRLRAGSREQYEEVHRFVVESLKTGDEISGDMLMEIIWSLLPKPAQKKIGQRPRAVDDASCPEQRPSATCARYTASRLQDLLLEELGMSEAIVRDGHAVIPRFRICTPDGHFVILMQLPDDVADRRRRIRLLGNFMAWKLATGFAISGHLHAADSISSCAVARDVRQGMMRRIERRPAISFGETTALTESDIEQGLIALLPRRETAMTSRVIAELERVFGRHGEMPAMRVS